MDENGWFVTLLIYLKMAAEAVIKLTDRHHHVCKFIAAVVLIGLCFPRAQAGGQNADLLGAIALAAMLYAFRLGVLGMRAWKSELQPALDADRNRLKRRDDNWLNNN